MLISDLLLIDDGLELLVGDDGIKISSITTLDYFEESSLLFLGNSKFLKLYEASNKRDGTETVILDSKLYQSMSESEKEGLGAQAKTLLVSENIALSISRISKPFYDKKIGSLNFQVDGRKLGTTKIHPSVRISENVFIGDGVVIGEDVTIMAGVTVLPNVTIGDNTVIYPNVTLYPFVEIGKNVRIHASCIIGCDGFGYNYDNGDHHKIWHMGGVKIGDSVELGASCCIDGGTFSPTIIENKTKLDNSVHVAHNVHLGTGVLLCAQVGIAGSARIGAFSVFGGHAAMADGVEIGSQCQVGGACIITSSWPDKTKLGGHPARPLKEWLRGLAFVRKNSLRK